MRLAIDGGGYATATTAFENGNQVAALHHDALGAKLAGYAGMAGDDATSTEFAGAYDAAAREAVAALAALVDAFATLGRLTGASLANHRDANARSVLGGASVYEGGSLPEGGFVAVLPSTPPSSLGAHPVALPAQLAWLLDHIAGFVWPTADADRLHDAAQTWRTTAESLDDLATYCDAAVRGFWGQRSPEIPLAVDATRELERTVREVAGRYAALATACDNYADHVEEKRHEVIALAEWLLEQVVEGVAISFAIGLVTAGAGAAASMAAVIARIAAESPRFLRILEALRMLAAGTASSVRATHEGLGAARLSLQKYAGARLATRGSEVGELNLWSRTSGWLRTHEHSGSHTLERHVGKTDEQLLQRLSVETHAPRASSFADEASAERLLERLVTRHAAGINHWLETGEPRMKIEAAMEGVTGRSADHAGHIVDVHRIRMVLVRDPSMPEGYRVLTAFPQP